MIILWGGCGRQINPRDIKWLAWDHTGALHHVFLIPGLILSLEEQQSLREAGPKRALISELRDSWQSH